MSDIQTLQAFLKQHPEVIRSDHRPGVFEIKTQGRDCYYDYHKGVDTDTNLIKRLKTAMTIIEALSPDIKELVINKYFDTGDYKILISIHDNAQVSVYIRYVAHPGVIRHTHGDVTIDHIARLGDNIETIYTVDKTFDSVDNFRSDFLDLLRQLKEARERF